MNRSTSATMLSLAAALVAAPIAAPAQEYPSRPIKIIVPFAPGSGSDSLGRIVGERLSEQLSAAVVIENRDGAGGVIGTQAAAKATADGYTLLLGGPPLATVLKMYPSPPFDPVADFAPIAQFSVQPLCLVVPSKSPFKTFKELVDFARANPAKLSYATSGKGTQSHLEVEYIARTIGVRMTDVPYKSTGQAMTDTMAGTVDLFFSGCSSSLPHVKAGKLNMLVAGSAARWRALPDVPTVAEASGMPNHQVVAWFGLLAPKGTPTPIVDKLHHGIEGAMTTSKARERLAGMGADVAILSPRQFADLIENEVSKWGQIVQSLGLKAQ